MHKDSPPIPVMRSPRTVDLEITSSCNLHCKYCYFFDNPKITYRDMPTGEWLQFIDELGKNSVMDVCLACGEPFARKDLPDLVEAIVENRMRFSILSNGTLIDEDIAEFIAGTGRCDSVQISIDGSCAEVHETGRGRGSFAGAVAGLKKLRKHKVPVTVRMTIHRRNVHDLENTARLLLEDFGLQGFTTNSAGYFGSCRKHGADLLLRVQDRQIAMETFLKLEQQYTGRITAQAGPLAEIHAWRKMDDAFRSGPGSFDNGGRLTGCGCPANKITVRADGTLVPCTMLSHLELGRINQDTLQDVWQNSPELNKLRKRCRIPLHSFKECSGCVYISYCTGNCPGSAFSLTGNINRPSPDACLRKFLAGGGKLSDFSSVS